MRELTAEPAETIWDTGPKHRGGPLMWLLALMTTFFSLTLFVAWIDDHNAAMLVFLLIVAPFASWAWWAIFSSRTPKGETPLFSTHLLHEHLKFIIPRTFNDVAITAFFRPDKPRSGDAICLLVFLENFSSRRRLVKIKLGKSAALVLPPATELGLLLAPGQAAVYRCPLQLYPATHAGDYEILLRFAIKSPRGQGRMLQSASGRKMPSGNQISVSSASYWLSPGFTVVAGESVTAQPLAEPAFLSLASPVTPTRFDVLRQISSHGPHQPITPEPPPVSGAPAA
jgi:hypothetical protein